jgi:hypothetical protein
LIILPVTRGGNNSPSLGFVDTERIPTLMRSQILNIQWQILHNQRQSPPQPTLRRPIIPTFKLLRQSQQNNRSINTQSELRKSQDDASAHEPDSTPG